VAFAAFCIVGFAALAINLWTLQVEEGTHFSALAQGNLVRREVLPAPRGILYDRHGTQLVVNRGSFAVAIAPVDLPRGSERTKVIDRLSKAIGVSGVEVERQVARHASEPFQAFVVKDKLDSTTYQLLSENVPTMPGVRLVTSSSRHYIDGAAMSHLLGYVGKLDPEEYKMLKDQGYRLDDVIGKNGLEYSNEKYLRGTDGISVVERDAHGNLVRPISTTDAVPGNNVYLTIDLTLQQEVEAELKASMAAAHKELGGNKGLSGSAVVMNPQTGEVLAMVSLPDYDINQFADGITVAQYQALVNDPRIPLLNRSISGQYPPGSTFKTVTASAALQASVVNRNSTIFCPGFLNRGGFNFGCWNTAGHHNQNVIEAIAHSCDVFFYTVADTMGDIVLNKFSKDFGVGRKTGVDLAGEAAGIAPDRDWKKKYFAQAFNETGDAAWKDDFWYEGNTITYGIGQSYLLVTPLQDLNWTATVANGGNYLKPQVTGKINAVSGAVVRPFRPIIDHKVGVDPKALAIVREGLRAAASTGGTSGFIFNQPEFRNVPSPSGKTGTAQYGTPDAKGNYATHAWYTAYAPVVDPEVAVVVFVDGGGEGHTASAPVAAKILSYYFAHKAAIVAN
jgi:penicillin-binding protein 2